MLIIILSILVLGLGGYIFYDKLLRKTNNGTQELKNNDNKIEENNSNNETNIDNSQNVQDSFNNNQYVGMTNISGYATVEKEKHSYYEDDNNCEYQNNCYEISHVYFHILDSKDKDFLEYSNEYKEPKLSDSNNVIVLGCFIDNKVNYVSFSDELKDQDLYLSENQTKKLLNSSKNNPINLQVLKLKFTGGVDGIDCWSDVTYLNVLD